MKLQVLLALAALTCGAGCENIVQADGNDPAHGVTVTQPCDQVDENGDPWAVLGLSTVPQEDIAANVYAYALPHENERGAALTTINGTTYPVTILDPVLAIGGVAAARCFYTDHSFPPVTAMRFYIRK